MLIPMLNPRCCLVFTREFRVDNSIWCGESPRLTFTRIVKLEDGILLAKAQSTTVVFVMVVIPVPVTNLQNQGKKLNNLLQ